MKQILPVLFLIFIVFAVLFSPKTTHSVTFEIGNPIREGDYFIVEASISGISSSSAYVQGMFTNTISPDYFGFIWGQKEDWVEYQSTNKELITTKLPILVKDTIQKIWVKPNYSNSGYKGPGDYHLKFKRFTGSSDSSAGESNTLTIYLLEPLPTPSPTPTPTSSTPTATETPPSTPTYTLAPTKTPTPTPLKTPTPSPTLTSTPSLLPTEKTTKPTSVISISPSISPSPEVELVSSSISGEILGKSDNLKEEQEENTLPVHKPFLSQVALKYTFVFGVITLSISGGILYFRHRKD